MSKITNRDAAPRHGRPVEDRLARLLDSPLLARVVPHLAPETLHQLVRHRGLEACGELVTSATPAQLTSLLDLDLWRHAQPGRDEQFDVDRFGEWVEVLVDTGSAVAARTVAALDVSLIVAGLSRYVRVFDPGIFEPTAQSDDEQMDRAEAMHEGDVIDVGAAARRDESGDGLECEIAGYMVRARRTDAWDAIVELLLALDAEHGACFDAVMRGCRRLSNSRPEIDGLDDVLMAPEQHLHDVTLERERRRSRQGYATSADARAFLQMARQPLASSPIAAAYFRAADEAIEEAAEEQARGPAHEQMHDEASIRDASQLAASHVERVDANANAETDADSNTAANANANADEEIHPSIEAVLDLLIEAGVMPERPRALLAAADADEDPRAARLSHVRRLLECVLRHDEMLYLTRSRELAFLANTLLAGCTVQSRPFTPREASDAAVCICNLGLESWPTRWPGAAPDTTSPGVAIPGPVIPDPAIPDDFLVTHGLVSAFEVGWCVLHEDVSLFVADQLVATLTELHHVVDRDTRRELAALRRVLMTQRAAGTPWRARGAAETLALLDMTAWTSVLGLLDECPILPEALRAVLDGRTTAVSATAFDFISTTAQIGDVHRFMRKLPELLSR